MIMDNNNISDNRLDGNVALITGASSGIGAGTAVLFSKLGADLSITGRNEANLRKTAEECEKFSRKKPLTIIADLVKESDVIRVIDDTIRHFGKLDILVNNAGIAESGTLFSTSLTQFDRVMDINVRSVFHLTKLAVPHLIKTKGRIVNVSSLSSNRPYPNILAYCMSKSAIDQFRKCMALELAPKQVRVNSVNRSAKNQRKADNKRWKLKEGSQFEDLALIAAMSKLIKAVDDMKNEMNMLLKTLVQFHYDEKAKELQTKYDKFLTLIEKSIPEIWLQETEESTTQPVLGPMTTANSIAQAVQRGTAVRSQETQDPIIRVPPTLHKEIRWKLHILEQART